MKGGYQIIDLRNLSLELSNSTGSITDVEILNQLRNLRAYIEKGHAFTKPLDNALKCVIVRYRDAKNGEKKEACNWANIETSNNSLTYEIKTKDLMIEVVFEEKTDEYENKYYDIKTAKYTYSNEIDIEGFATFESDVEIKGDLAVEGNATFDETHFEDNAYIFENIVDKDGHKRFIEGDITLNEIEGITQRYGKWSLSGTHLILSVSFEVANATVIPAGMLYYVELPQWIFNKIVPVYTGGSIEGKTINLYSTSQYSTQGVACTLQKSSDRIQLYVNTLTLTDTRAGRITFDLLIDNE